MAARPFLLGHRGARKYVPENTIAAFQMALGHGCDGFEFDVRMTADGRAVICHDAKFCGLSVAKSNYQKLVDVGRKCEREIATLEDVLRFGTQAFLNIELKVLGAEDVLVNLLGKYPTEKGVIVSSFLPKVIRRLGELRAEVPLGLICENRRQLAKWRELPIQALMLKRTLVSRKLIERILTTSLKPKEGLNGAPDAPPRIFVWTVNSGLEMVRFAEMGVDGIISDDTKLLVKTLG